MQVRARLSIAIAAVFAANVHAQSVIRSIAGGGNEKLGSAIANAGDTNGDNWDDYLVGAPNANNGLGRVTCVSGKYLATGIAPSTLYTYTLPVGAGYSSNFGWSIAALGDVNGDGAIDFAVGAPFYDSNGAGGLNDCGAVFFFNGATHVPGAFAAKGQYTDGRYGWSLSATGDINGDGVCDVIAGAPGSIGYADLISGAHLAAGLSAVFKTFPAPAIGTHWGESVLGNVDLNGDGLEDIAIAAPMAHQTGHTDQGMVQMFQGNFAFTTIGDFWGPDGNEIGRAMTGGADFDGDSYPDIVVSSFAGDAGSIAGKVFVLSGHRMVLHTPPYEVFTLTGPNQFTGTASFGASVAIAPDLNADGVPDVIVGMPTHNPTLLAQVGGVRIFSGATGAKIGGFAGTGVERLGSAALAVVDDLDADGFPDFLVGGSEADVPNMDGGVLKALRLFPAMPSKYCVGKLNSHGCTPSMTWQGVASASSSSPFLVGAVNVINQRNGVLFYGYAPYAVPFQGGLKCVHAPLRRTSVQSSGGSATGVDCTGSFSHDFNARIQSGVDPQLVPGAEVFCQYWSRDPQSPSTTSLSDALSFLVNP